MKRWLIDDRFIVYAPTREEAQVRLPHAARIEPAGEWREERPARGKRPRMPAALITREDT